MPRKPDFYEVLGVERGSGAVEIKTAYRKLAVKYHPDQNPGDGEAEARFKLISEAYSVLSDTDRRRRYDATGHFEPGAGGFNGDFGSIGDMLEGFLGDVFGRRAAAPPPKDLKYNLRLRFEEAALGVDKEIEYERQELCPSCQGGGAAPEATRSECPACEGRGAVRFQRGFLATSRPCSACEGTGIHPDAKCNECTGRGTTKRHQRCSVRIPAGVKDGAVRSVAGAGDQGRSGSGALHVQIEVAPHPLFEREGADLHCEVPVSFPQAALGDQIEVPTLEGKVTMKLPPGTQPGKIFRLRGKGLPVFGGAGKGDQLVRITLEVPGALTDGQRTLIGQLAEELKDEAHPRQKGFLDKLKELF